MSELQHVIALTRLHISQHYANDERFCTDPDSYQFFADYAKKSQSAARPSPSSSPPPSPQTKPIPRPKPTPPKSPVKTEMETNKGKTEAAAIRTNAIKREPQSAPQTMVFEDFRKILQECFPAIKILDSQPDDAGAKELSQAWQKQNTPPEIVIIDSSSTPLERRFLDNIARALDAFFYPTAVLTPQELTADLTVRLAVGVQDSLNNHPYPFLAMKSIEHYLQQPVLKAELWQELKNTLQSS
jgi:hypothetical protein